MPAHALVHTVFAGPDSERVAGFLPPRPEVRGRWRRDHGVRSQDVLLLLSLWGWLGCSSWSVGRPFSTSLSLCVRFVAFARVLFTYVLEMFVRLVFPVKVRK